MGAPQEHFTATWAPRLLWPAESGLMGSHTAWAIRCCSLSRLAHCLFLDLGSGCQSFRRRSRFHDRRAHAHAAQRILLESSGEADYATVNLAPCRRGSRSLEPNLSLTPLP